MNKFQTELDLGDLDFQDVTIYYTLEPIKIHSIFLGWSQDEVLNLAPWLTKGAKGIFIQLIEEYEAPQKRVYDTFKEAKGDV